MMEGNPEMAQPPNLTSMTDKEFFELVWENGQLLTRDLSRKAQRNPSCNGHPSDKAHGQVKNGGDTFPLKRTRFENLDSVLDNPYHDKRNLNINFNYNNCLEDDNFHESLPEVYQTHLYEFLEQNKGDSFGKYHKESQVVPEYANLRRNTESSTKQYREPAQFKRPRANSRKNLVTVRELPMEKLQEQDLRSGGKRVTTNFSPFLGSPALLQVKSQWTGPTSAEDLNNNRKRSSPCGNIDPLESMPIAAANDSKSVKGFHDQPNLMETTVELLPLGAKPADKLLPDNESEAVRREYASPNQIYGQTLNIAANKGKEKLTNTQKAIELPVPSSSLCSGGASNNPTYTLKRRYDDTEGSADHPSQNIERKTKSVTKAVPGSKNKAKSMTKASKRNRKKRTAEFHNLSERKRRDKINKKMRALQELIPNCNQVDKASMLDEAIEYLKILQLRVQMMSMGNRVCVPHVSPMRMHMGIGCSPFPIPPNFLFPPIPGATAVPGFSPQLLPMSLLPAQLGLLNTTANFPGVSLASAPTQLRASPTLPNSKDFIHNITSEEGKIHGC